MISRGNLFINLNLKIPILTELQLRDNEAQIQGLIEIPEDKDDDENKI